MQGIDVSFWQQDNYKRLIDTYAKDFVIARATFDFGVDQFCDPIYQYAKSKGKNLGVYFFPLTESSDPETSADWCVEQVKGYIGNTVFFLDWESTNGTDVSKTWWALRWLKRFEEKSGVKSNIYMNTSTVREFNWSEVAANDNGLWLADYGSNDGYDHGVPDIPYWSIVMMHQYTSVGDGGSGLDKDVFFGDVNAWNAYAGIKPVVNELDQLCTWNNIANPDMIYAGDRIMAYFGPTIVPHATYDEFRSAVLGNGYDMDGWYGPQCWDGADLIWYQYGLTLYTGPQGYAVECWTVSRSLNAVYPFTDIYTGPQGIKRGDIVVFAATSGNPAGHIAFADEDYNGGSTLSCLGQNQGPGSGISGLPFNIWPNNASEIIGAFRNTNWQGTPPTPTAKKSGFPWVLYARRFRNGGR